MPRMSRRVKATMIITAGRLRSPAPGCHPEGHDLAGRGAHAAGRWMPKVVQQADDVARPADRDGGRAHGVFEDQVPADDPGDELAQRRIGVGVGAAERASSRPVRRSRDRRRRTPYRQERRTAISAGPAKLAAALPVSTKMPAPMMQPMPRQTSENGPKVLARLSPCPSALAAMAANDLRPVNRVIAKRRPPSRHWTLRPRQRRAYGGSS